MEAGKQICHASLKDPESCHVFGGAMGRTKLDLDLKLGISDIYSAQSIRDKHAFNQVDNKFINAGSSTLAAANVNFNINQTHEGQSIKQSMDLTSATEMHDPKRLRRIMANRISSRNYRLKKLQEMEQLEKKIKDLEQRISDLRRQIAETKIKQQVLMIERHNLKLRITAVQNNSQVREAEIANNMAEVKRLIELLHYQFQANTHHAMPNSDDGRAANAKLDLNLTL